MISKKSRNSMREVRHARIRTHLSGTSAVPRLNVFRFKHCNLCTSY